MPSLCHPLRPTFVQPVASSLETRKMSGSGDAGWRCNVETMRPSRRLRASLGELVLRRDGRNVTHRHQPAGVD